MKEMLFKIARSQTADRFIGFTFENMSALMPVDRILNTPKTIVFAHPVPQWENHLLAVPKKAFKNLLAVNFDDTGHRSHIVDIVDSIQETAKRKQLPAYAVMLSGGRYQDVPQVHFHILSGQGKSGAQPISEQYGRGDEEGMMLKQGEGFTVMQSSNPLREFHLIFQSEENIGNINSLDTKNESTIATVSSMFKEIQRVVRDNQLDAYTVFAANQPSMPDKRLTLHLVSSKK